MPGSRTKVFGIGLPRTGTTSLSIALNRVGVATVHFPFGLFRSLDHPILGRYEGFVDSPVPLVYRELDSRYPGSKFILTLRPVEAWLPSMEWMMREGRIIWAWDDAVASYHRKLLGTDRFDEQVLRRAFRQHVDGAREYFRNRPDDLLEMDASAGAGYPELCSFLGVPPVVEPFPVGNARRRASTLERLIYPVRRLARRFKRRG